MAAVGRPLSEKEGAVEEPPGSEPAVVETPASERAVIEPPSFAPPMAETPGLERPVVEPLSAHAPSVSAAPTAEAMGEDGHPETAAPPRRIDSQAALHRALDSLGQAHHRPFSRA